MTFTSCEMSTAGLPAERAGPRAKLAKRRMGAAPAEAQRVQRVVRAVSAKKAKSSATFSGLAGILFAISTIFALSAAAKEPPVPPGLAPAGAVMVALLGPGVDYRLPELKDRFARDGEGDLISWDFSDNDSKPFAATASESERANPAGLAIIDGSDAARTVANLAPKAQLVVVKERPDDPQSFGHMMTFVTNTPARIIVWLDADPKRPDWPILQQAVKRFSDRLFVIPLWVDDKTDLDRSPAYEGLRGATNVLIASWTVSKEQVAQGPKAVDVWMQLPLSKRETVQGVLRTMASMMAGLTAHELSAEAALNIAQLKQRVINAQPKGIATSPGFYSADDVTRLLKNSMP